MKPIIIPKEFIREYFLHAYKVNNDSYEIINDLSDKHAPITDKYDFINPGNKFFAIWCNKGHLIKASMDTMKDLIENGCPFCANQKCYDWQRHIDYSFELNNYSFVSHNVEGIKHPKNLFIQMISKRDKVKTIISPYQIDINMVEYSDNFLFEGISYNAGFTETNIEFLADPLTEISARYKYGKITEQNIIPLVGNYDRLIKNYNAAEDDIFFVQCKKCQLPRLVSALTINNKDYECPCCKSVIIRKQKWFNYNYCRYNEKSDLWTNNFIFLNPKYGKKLTSLKEKLGIPKIKKIKKEETMIPKETSKVIRCSLMDWCTRPENKEIGQIVIEQFAPVKNRRKLSEIDIDSDEVIWLRSSKGSLFDTTVKTIVKERKIREKLPVGTSYPELFIYSALKYCYPDAIHRYRTSNNLEFDIFIPSIKQCIEYNGCVYHKIKYDTTKRDEEKKIYCDNNSINLLVIEDDNKEEKMDLDGYKIKFMDNQKQRDQHLYELCKWISIYLFIEKELPSIEEIKNSINLFY